MSSIDPLAVPPVYSRQEGHTVGLYVTLLSGVITYWVELAHIVLALIPDGTHTTPQQIATEHLNQNQ